MNRMNIIYTIHVKHDIGNQAELVTCFNLLKQEALEKKLLISACLGKFSIDKVGSTGRDMPLFITEELDALKQFIDQYKENLRSGY
jgi:hypothetical protein